MCVFNCALNKLNPEFKESEFKDSEFKEVAPAEQKRSKAELSIVARSNPELSKTELSKTESPILESEESSEQIERSVDHRLFNWITILLLTGWILVVGVAANTAEVPKSVEAPTVQAFIEDLI